MADLGEGTVVDGRYRVVEKIGSGGMADVWLAEDTHLGRRIALKVLHARFGQDREFVERFRREAESAAGLQHPNVVGIFDRGTAEGNYYIAMELLEGRSFQQLIRAGLAPTDTVRIIRQILEAAGFAHRNGIVHRDFKPSNVIVGADGKATVTDFGIARAGVSEITQTGSVMGTAHYLSPEQAQGLDVTPASDLYSIGVMLYEALTKQVPFDGESAVAVALKQVSQTPEPPSTINPAVSPALDAVVMRALEKEPAARFPDAPAFIAALDHAMEDPGGASLAPAPVVVEEIPEDEEEERRDRRRLWILVALAVLVGALVGLYLTRPTTTDVPNVVGLDRGDATQALNEEGFDVGEIIRDQAPQPAGRVLEQNPTDNQEPELDCAFLRFFCDKPDVDLTVSAGPGTAEVPRVAGLPAQDATELIEDEGFDVTEERTPSSAVEEGLVIRTDPAAGEELRRGSQVILIVSSGPREVTVPGVVGSLRAQAVSQLRGRGLVPSVSSRESDQPEGQVLEQSPSPGSRVEVGTSVDIVISSGVATVSVPSLVGSPRPDAVAALRELGLSPAITEREVADQGKNQIVLQQSPSGGAELEEGEIVTLVIGVYVAPEPEPEPEPQPEPAPEPEPSPGPGEPTTPRQRGPAG